MENDDYRAYLLRLWRVEDHGKHWRARLENIGTGEYQGFASLEKLIEFLKGLEEDPHPGADPQDHSFAN